MTITIDALTPSQCDTHRLQITCPSHMATVEAITVKSGFFLCVTGDTWRCLMMPGSQLTLPTGHITYAIDNYHPMPLPKQAPYPPVTPMQTVTHQAMILGAGLATRFEPVSGPLTGLPKPGVPLLGDDSVITCLAKHLYQHGIRHLIVNTFYKPDCIKAQLATLSDMTVSFVDESAPSGTAGGLVKALDGQIVDTSQPVLIMQGDAVTNANVSYLLDWHSRQPGAVATLGVKTVNNDAVSKMAIVQTDEAGHASGRVTSYTEKPALADVGSNRTGSIGFYVLAPDAYADFVHCGKTRWQYAPDFDYALHYFPWLLQNERKLMACHMPAPFYWSDIGQPSDYMTTMQAVYAGYLTPNIPQPVQQYLDDGVVYWPGAWQAMKAAQINAKGHIIAMATFPN